MSAIKNPVSLDGKRNIRDAEMREIGFVHAFEAGAEIVRAINCHERLVSIAERWKQHLELTGFNFGESWDELQKLLAESKQ